VLSTSFDRRISLPYRALRLCLQHIAPNTLPTGHRAVRLRQLRLVHIPLPTTWNEVHAAARASATVASFKRWLKSQFLGRLATHSSRFPLSVRQLGDDGFPPVLWLVNEIIMCAC